MLRAVPKAFDEVEELEVELVEEVERSANSEELLCKLEINMGFFPFAWITQPSSAQAGSSRKSEDSVQEDEGICDKKSSGRFQDGTGRRCLQDWER